MNTSCCAVVALDENGNGAGPVSTEWMLLKSLWIKHSYPEI